MVKNEYLDLYIKELKKMIDTAFTKLNGDIFDIQIKLELLSQEVKRFQKATETRDPFKPNCELGDYTDAFSLLVSTEESSVKKNLKHVFDSMAKDLKGKNARKKFHPSENKVEVVAKELSVDIVDQTPSREKIFTKRKFEKIEEGLKEYRIGNSSVKRMTKMCTAYDPFAVVDQAKADWLDAWMKIGRDVTVDLDTGDGDADKIFFSDLMTPKKWLDDRHINACMTLIRRGLSKVPCPFRSERLAFMDVPFTVLIQNIYKNFLANPEEFVWSGMLLDYFNGVLPRCGQTFKRLGVDVDDVYVVQNINNNHWVALAISIIHQEIQVFDSAISHTDIKAIYEFVKPYAKLFPHFMRTLTVSGDKNASVVQYKIRRRNNIPQNTQSGDCGVYALKYIECLALDCDMEVGLRDGNMKTIRKNMAVEVFAAADHCKGF